MTYVCMTLKKVYMSLVHTLSSPSPCWWPPWTEPSQKPEGEEARKDMRRAVSLGPGAESAFESTDRSCPAHNEWPWDILFLFFFFFFVSLLSCVMQASVDSLIFQNWHLMALPTQGQKCVKSARSVHPVCQWHGLGKQLNLASSGSTVLITFAVWAHPGRHYDLSSQTMASVIRTESFLGAEWVLS